LNTRDTEAQRRGEERRSEKEEKEDGTITYSLILSSLSLFSVALCLCGKSPLGYL
jgi:hypothetical protein